jgi:tRNA pseudouridine38-40 synthase
MKETGRLLAGTVEDSNDKEMAGPRPAATIALTVAYDGAPFAGFARQPGVETVQARLESALATVLRRPIDLVCAGRTDAGVHAMGQVVSFAAAGNEPESASLLRSLNALVGSGIVVSDVRYAVPRFSARFDAVSREYRYRIAIGPVPPLFLKHVTWWVKRELNLDAMQRGAELLIGEHDFRSFCVTNSAVGRRTVRRLDTVEIAEDTQLGEKCLVVRVVGNAFLHSMVRTIVGTLVEVGLGHKDVAWVAEVLAACERSAAGQAAPSQGLTLWSVDYPAECWR